MPYPHALDQDQAANAALLAQSGAATVVRQADFTPDSLASIWRAALADPAVGDVHNIRIYTKANGTSIVTLHIKFDPDISLKNAHEISERVETAVARVDPEIITVYTHLEPLEAPVALRDAPVQGSLTGSIERILGRPPLRLEVRQSEVGPVALLTISNLSVLSPSSTK